MSSNNPLLTISYRVCHVLLSRRAVWFYWIVNIGILVGLIIWICGDGQFPKIAQLTEQANSWKDTSARSNAVPHNLTTRVKLLQTVILLGFASGIGLLVTLFGGTKSNRSMRAWLAVMVLSATWMTLVISWPGLSLSAQAWRLKPSLPAMENLAVKLLSNWPNGDEQLPEIGAFTAFPIGNPMSLTLFEKTTLHGTNIQLSTILRVQNSDLQFLLSGNEEGALLGYFPNGIPSFVLSNTSSKDSQLNPQKKLGKKWLLVRPRVYE